jgi:hypothetical protein
LASKLHCLAKPPRRGAYGERVPLEADAAGICGVGDDEPRPIGAGREGCRFVSTPKPITAQAPIES